jgi:hypothetical protein
LRLSSCPDPQSIALCGQVNSDQNCNCAPYHWLTVMSRSGVCCLAGVNSTVVTNANALRYANIPQPRARPGGGWAGRSRSRSAIAIAVIAMLPSDLRSLYVRLSCLPAASAPCCRAAAAYWLIALLASGSCMAGGNDRQQPLGYERLSLSFWT